ncbi:MAG: hypothetical protein JWO22_5, partial [Frankiales bacterium]|nr:hypothetical protein [Frankiales bacterium]
MSRLAGWDESVFEAEGRGYPVFRRGTGPGVIVIHEIPGITPKVQHFAEEVVDAGFTVVMPSLFGKVGVPMSGAYVAKSLAQVCISKEFTAMATNRTSHIASWTRALAASLHEELGGPGVGALGMCFTGGFALAMMVDTSVAAPVLAQPSAPFAVSPARSRDLNLSPTDLAAVKQRAAAGCQVLGLRYKQDPAVGKRFETLTSEIGDAFIRVEFEGRKHSTLTVHRQ